MSSTESNHHFCPQAFPICVINDQLQLCIHPCSDNLKRQWQQCWYRLLIQIVYSEDVFSLLQTANIHMGPGLEGQKDVATPPSPIVASDFAHHISDEALHGPGTKWHHAQAVVLCTVKNKAHLILQECILILAIDRRTNWHGMVEHKSVSAEEHGCLTFRAP